MQNISYELHHQRVACSLEDDVSSSMQTHQMGWLVFLPGLSDAAGVTNGAIALCNAYTITSSKQKILHVTPFIKASWLKTVTETR